tara:strand:- start:162 stop:617 length:456 start_codon:yes stop_codon:yes gene_type:complete
MTMTRYWGCWGIVFVSLIADQLSKYVARTVLVNGGIDLGVFRFDLVFNTGAAYGVFSDHTMVLLIIGVAVIVYLCTQLRSLVHNVLTCWAYGLLLAGAIGNSLDRLLFGQVTDFINIHIIPVFNLADIYLNIGLIVLVGHYLLYERQRSAN